MKVCKTLFGRINRPSQSCSRFARCKKFSSPYGCRSWNIFLLSVGQVLLSPLRRRYLHQCQLQCLLVLRFEPRKWVQSSKLPSSETVPDFLSSLPLSSAGFLSRFLFLLYLPQIQTFLYCQHFLLPRRFHMFYVKIRPPKACAPNFVRLISAHGFCAFGMFYDWTERRLYREHAVFRRSLFCVPPLCGDLHGWLPDCRQSGFLTNKPRRIYRRSKRFSNRTVPP